MILNIFYASFYTVLLHSSMGSYYMCFYTNSLFCFFFLLRFRLISFTDSISLSLRVRICLRSSSSYLLLWAHLLFCVILCFNRFGFFLLLRVFLILLWVRLLICFWFIFGASTVSTSLLQQVRVLFAPTVHLPFDPSFFYMSSFFFLLLVIHISSTDSTSLLLRELLISSISSSYFLLLSIFIFFHLLQPRVTSLR